MLKAPTLQHPLLSIQAPVRKAGHKGDEHRLMVCLYWLSLSFSANTPVNAIFRAILVGIGARGNRGSKEDSSSTIETPFNKRTSLSITSVEFSNSQRARRRG
jgi:hypothetical protein